MEIHKPKPIHSWRELLTEIGVVVIGVSIALAAEQTVEWLHWRARVADAREVIATELTTNMVGAIARVRTRNCTEARLDALSLMLDEAAKKGALPPVGDVGVPPRANYPSGAWDSVMASQAASHFPRQLLADLSSAYKRAQRLEEFSFPEIQSWQALYTMVGPGRRLDPPSEAALRQALSSARIDNRVLASLGSQLIDLVGKLHLRLGTEDKARLAAAQDQPLSQYTVCRPIGAVTASYGQGYRNTSEAQLEDSLKSLRARLQANDE
ncbi:MAG: hypothetical protein JO256_02150 [Alphaproteobacteria bacterium]|nr:hypothetical protein [Alphaproteobacteria bacterium]